MILFKDTQGKEVVLDPTDATIEIRIKEKTPSHHHGSIFDLSLEVKLKEFEGVDQTFMFYTPLSPRTSRITKSIDNARWLLERVKELREEYFNLDTTAPQWKVAEQRMLYNKQIRPNVPSMFPLYYLSAETEAERKYREAGWEPPVIEVIEKDIELRFVNPHTNQTVIVRSCGDSQFKNDLDALSYSEMLEQVFKDNYGDPLPPAEPEVPDESTDPIEDPIGDLVTP